MADSWFRYHNNALFNRKVQQLDGELFKAWVNILSVVSLGNGVRVTQCDIEFHLRTSQDVTCDILAKLKDADLLDINEDGVIPIDWDKWQYKKTTSAARTKAYRERIKTRQANDKPANTPKCGANSDGHSDVTATPPDITEIVTESVTEIAPDIKDTPEESGSPAEALKTKPKKPKTKTERLEQLGRKFPAPTGVVLLDWGKCLEARKAKGHLMTDTAVEKFVTGFERVQAELGCNADVITELIIQKGWGAVKTEWVKNSLGSDGAGNGRQAKKLSPHHGFDERDYSEGIDQARLESALEGL